ncbi:YodL domain-containing protein [[Clostridium] symbiosum]|uniref:YodL domain-containing protein n=1 Tax=Clostridium symbiosum TaxID=1512 RepID=UPI001680BA02|nr:YodL domain-containing protein [[Clostridium] symbiosum]
MASLRDTVKQYQEELRDGIAWVAFWREGRSWNGDYFYLEANDALTAEDKSRLEEIRQKDPAAVMLNSYYCGYLGEDMTVDELTAGVRRHYENGYNSVADFIEAHDDTLPPEVLEEARQAAHAAGLPFHEKPYDGEDIDPYVYDGHMSMEDYDLMHKMIAQERSENRLNYSSYDRDHLDAADRMRIERSIYFESGKADISALTALPLAELIRQREESAAAEQAIFEVLKQQAAAWEAQAGNTLTFDKAIEYARTPAVTHTENQWQADENNNHTISNNVYQMRYHIYENTRYDREQGKSIPYSYTLTWGVHTNSPDRYGQAKIAGQDRKVFADKAAMEKYLNGRIKAYQHLFTEISPTIPQEYAEHFKVNGQLLPGYTVEGEEQQTKQEQTAPEKIEPDAAISPQAEALTAEPTQPRPVIPIVLTSEKPAEKLKEITDRLEQGIKELFDSERYKEYLRVMSKFHNYSFNNTLLIAMQKPDASLIAGFNAWKNNFKRNVMKGEKGIKILAPSPFKIKQEMEKIDPATQKPVIGADGKPVTEEKEITIPAFKVVSVFDVSQTEGKEIPNLAVDMLTGDVERFKDVFAALEKTSPVPIGFEKIEGGAHGYYHLEEKRIAIDEGMSELQTLKTAIHEIAHAKLHDIDLNAPVTEQTDRPDRRTREVQAESVAYAVCQHYGLDTSDYSFGYVAGWSSGRELDELKSSLETIRSAAAEIINSIDGYLKDLQQEQETEQTATLPDPTIQITDMQEYGYTWDGMLPLQQEAAERLFHEDLEIFCIYEDGTEGAVTSLSELKEHAENGGLFGVEKAAWKAFYERTNGKAQEETKAAPELPQEKDTFSIYQLKRDDETVDLRFEPYDRLTAAGHTVDMANYDRIYIADLAPGTSLEDIYTRFNVDHPKDFKGHSLSVSDVVVLHQNGQDTAHYVDSIGYKEVPEFWKQPENPLKHVEDTIEQNDNNFDGIINNTPTVDELEKKAKSGEQISLTDLSDAIKTDKQRGKGKEEKRSIRAQLKAEKQRTAQKKTRAKSQDLERS